MQLFGISLGLKGFFFKERKFRTFKRIMLFQSFVDILTFDFLILYLIDLQIYKMAGRKLLGAF